MRVEDAVDHGNLALDIGCTLETIVAAGAETRFVQIRRKIRDGGRDAGIECTAVGEMAAKTHARRANAPGAGGQGEEGVNGQRGVFVISCERLSQTWRLAMSMESAAMAK